MRKELDMESWNRKEHFQFFSSFDEPFFGIAANLDCTIAYQEAKNQETSFFLHYLHKTLQAVNAIEEMRYRIEDGKVYVYDWIHASPTLSRADHTFAFGFITYHPLFEIFVANANAEMEAVQASSGLRLNDQTGRIDTIHFSAVPWVSFTGLSHARHFAYKDSVPKISVGKYFMQDGKMQLPVSVHAHHGLMDGYHVGQFFAELQRLFDEA